MNPTNVIIIDDDVNCIALLELLFNQFFPDITVLSSQNTVKDGIEAIEKFQPDLVFLDIELPDGFGFDVISACNYSDYEVVFTSSHHEYSLKAFEFAALHYLLKPVTYDKLNAAISRSKNHKTFDRIDKKIQVLKESIAGAPKNIILPTGDGFEFFNIDEIIRCESEGAYTKIFLSNSKPILVSKILHNFEVLLNKNNFVRVHNKHLVNLKFIKKYVKGKSSYLVLSEGTEVPISESKKDEFKEKLMLFAQEI